MQPDLLPFHRPDRSLVVTGISRSGTSLLTALVDHLDDAVCLNEVLPRDVAALPVALARTRRDLLRGRPVPNKFAASGEPTTDTVGAAFVKEKRRVDRPLSVDFWLGTKRNLPYLNALEALLDGGYTVLAMIRDPVLTLASWGTERAAAAGIPGARVEPGALHPHLAGLALASGDPVERRAEIWQHYAARLHRFRDRVTVITHEQLCAAPGEVLAGLAARLGLRPGALPPGLVDPSRAAPGRHGDLGAIRAAVARRCPAREAFGY